MMIVLLIISFFLLLFIFWQISNLISLAFGVPFVQTPKEQIKEAFQMADLKPDEKVYDLGSGDGSVLIVAVKDFKARAMGFEISPWYYLLSQYNLKQARINSFAKVVYRDLNKVDLNKADVVYLYLMPKVIKNLEEKFRNLRKGLRIISFKFPILNLKPLRKNGEIYVYKS